MNVMDKLMKRICSGKPVELTEASPEVVAAREILEKEGTYKNTDFCGSVYWSPDKAVAVVKF